MFLYISIQPIQEKPKLQLKCMFFQHTPKANCTVAFFVSSADMLPIISKQCESSLKETHSTNNSTKKFTHIGHKTWEIEEMYNAQLKPKNQSHNLFYVQKKNHHHHHHTNDNNNNKKNAFIASAHLKKGTTRKNWGGIRMKKSRKKNIYILFFALRQRIQILAHG